MSTNKLFAIEGPEGSFKSTVARKVAERLVGFGIPAVSSREPGGVEVAEKIREIVVNDEMCSETEVLLFLAARVEHYNKFIQPEIDKGNVVILDRFIYSSLSIQGAGRGFDTSVIGRAHKLMLGERINHVTFYINVDPKETLHRKRGDEVQKFEREAIGFHVRAHEYMLKACNENYDVIEVAGGDGIERTSDDIADDIATIIKLIQSGYSVINVGKYDTTKYEE